MPGFNSTGPLGMGPMTGGGMGFCAIPRRNHWLPSFRRRNRAYYSRSWNTPFPPQVTKEEELDFLKSESQALKRTLEGIDARIKELVEEVK